MILIDCLNNYIQDKSVYCSAATIYYYQSNLTYFIQFLAARGIEDSRQLSSDVLKDYVFFLKECKNCKNTSIHTYFRAIRNFCAYLIDEELCDPFRFKLKLPRPDPELVLPLSSQEAAQLLSYVQAYSPGHYVTRNLLIVHLMLDCGLRSSEVRHLSADHVNFDQGYFLIKCSKYNKSRSLPLPDSVRALMLQLISAGLDPSGCFIPVSESALKSYFARLKTGTGIARLHPHLLRHTFASSYMTYYQNLEFLRLYMGHSSYAVTQKYLHISSECLLTSYDIYKIPDVYK